MLYARLSMKHYIARNILTFNILQKSIYWKLFSFGSHHMTGRHHYLYLSASLLVMHQSFVTTAPPHLRGWGEDSGANVRGSDLLSSPTVPGLWYIIPKYTSLFIPLSKFVAYAPVICNHCSPPPHPTPHLWGWAEDSGANVRGSDLLSSSTVPGKCGACDI